MKDTEIRKLFGQKVQFLRKQKGLTQFELANLIEKAEDTISNIERAKTATSVEVAIQIAHALDVSLGDLFELNLFDKNNKKKTELLKKLFSMLKEHNINVLDFLIKEVKNLEGLLEKKNN